MSPAPSFTASALGARIRKVIFFSAETSGEMTRGPCGPRAVLFVLVDCASTLTAQAEIIIAAEITLMFINPSIFLGIGRDYNRFGQTSLIFLPVFPTPKAPVPIGIARGLQATKREVPLSLSSFYFTF